MASQVAQGERIRLPMQEKQETQVRSLGQEDPLEKEMATYSSTLARRISGTEEPGRLQSIGSDMTKATESTSNNYQMTGRLENFWNVV